MGVVNKGAPVHQQAVSEDAPMWYWLLDVVQFSLGGGRPVGPLPGSTQAVKWAGGLPVKASVGASNIRRSLGLTQVVRVCALLGLSLSSGENLAVTQK